MENNHISAYDEEKHKGLVRHVLIRYGFKTDEIIVCLDDEWGKTAACRKTCG